MFERNEVTGNFHCLCGHEERISKEFKNHCEKIHKNNISQAAPIPRVDEYNTSDIIIENSTNISLSPNISSVIELDNVSNSAAPVILPTHISAASVPILDVTSIPIANDVDVTPTIFPYDLSKQYLDFLRSIGFQVNSTFKVLICVECMYAVVPSNIPGHLSNTHKISFKNILSTLNDIVKHFQISTSASVSTPEANREAIDGLKISDGLACSICSYVCLAHSSAEKHIHGATKPTFQPCKAQTFFYPTYIRYFSVIVPIQILSPSNRYQHFVQQILPSLPKISIGAPSTTREIPPLLRQTQWHVYLKDWIQEPSKRQAIKSLVKAANKKEPWTLELLKAVELYMQDIRGIADTVDFIVLKKIMHESEYVVNFFFLCAL